MPFRLEDNVPEIYVEKSRDFQLLCRVLDIFLAAAIERSARISGDWDLSSLDEALLPLAARKLGFTEFSYFPPKVLRSICKSYAHIVRNKGTLRAVREAAYAVLAADQDIYNLEVTRESTEQVYSAGKGGVTVKLSASAKEEANLAYLEKLLPYVLPAGVELTNSIEITNALSAKVPPIYSVVAISRIRGVGKSISAVVAKADGNKLPTSSSWEQSLDSMRSQERSYSKVGVGLVVQRSGSVSVAVRDVEKSNGKIEN